MIKFTKTKLARLAISLFIVFISSCSKELDDGFLSLKSTTNLTQDANMSNGDIELLKKSFFDQTFNIELQEKFNDSVRIY